MSNFDSSIPHQEFNLKYASEGDLTDSDEEVFELNSDFEEFTVSNIEAELEQVNVEHNFDNNQEERDEIIPNDENEGLTTVHIT
ncbi:unnamed protein product [Rhizophagus irregularis]|uniref:Uncharacterized protein n=1 Tax=Rhizophagus irregularis TaxID=588596 RepID=A0A916EIW2_9GLOM|nr:unnamed protein product [Rhizophagus irregularis]CAB5200020.1 unnamed protein product [Rhizophagus irregularis]CAB5391646.1 unnamed protein product [Rhizophagus irregularis]